MKIQHEVTPIGDRSWRIDEALGTAHVYAYLLEGNERALLVDTCQGFGNIAAVVRQLTDKPVAVVNTHGHLDHIGASHAFGTVYLHRADWPVAAEHASKAYRLAMLARFAEELELDITPQELDAVAGVPGPRALLPLENGQVLDMGGRRLEVVCTPGHTPGSVCLLEAERGWLFSGDTVCDQGVLLSFAHSCPVQTYGESLLALKARENAFSAIHPGHHLAPLQNEIIGRYLACAGGILDGSIEGLDFVSAGEACLVGLGEGIAISYQKDKLYK